MSYSEKREVQCVCGNVFETELVLVVNVERQPEIKDFILDGRFNVVKCPECGKYLYIEVPFFYLDLRESIVVYVYPESYKEEEEKFVQEAVRNFNKVISDLEEIEKEHKEYFMEVLFGIENLIGFLQLQQEEEEEKILLEEVGKSLGLNVIEIPLSKARKNNVISKLPYVGSVINVENIMEGLKILISNYKQLKVYRCLLKEIEIDSKVKEKVENLIKSIN